MYRQRGQPARFCLQACHIEHVDVAPDSEGCRYIQRTHGRDHVKFPLFFTLAQSNAKLNMCPLWTAGAPSVQAQITQRDHIPQVNLLLFGRSLRSPLGLSGTLPTGGLRASVGTLGDQLIRLPSLQAKSINRTPVPAPKGSSFRDPPCIVLWDGREV